MWFQRRSVYIGLGLVALLAYARLWTGPKPAAPVSSSALTHSLGDDTSLEHPIEMRELLARASSRPHLMRWLSLWTAMITLLGLGGICLNVRAVWRRSLIRLFRYRSRLEVFWSFREVAQLIALLLLVLSLLPFVHLSAIVWVWSELADPRLWAVISMLAVDSLVILFIWGFAAAKGWRLGRKPSASRAVAIGQGLVSYAAMFPWIAGLLWLIIRTCQQLHIEPPIEPIHELLFLEPRRSVVVLTVVLACVVGPVAEELFFRGVVFRALRSQASRLVAMLISGGLFAAVHTNLIGFLPIVVLGCLLADVYERTGSLWSSIAVHMVHNTLLVGLGLTIRALAAS